LFLLNLVWPLCASVSHFFQFSKIPQNLVLLAVKMLPQLPVTLVMEAGRNRRRQLRYLTVLLSALSASCADRIATHVATISALQGAANIWQ
jgi:hypothetical protein